MTSYNPIYSILYIDEVEQNLTSFKSTFSQDYHIITATSGRAGLEIMEQKIIQLVITDQRIPDMSGIEFMEKILILYPDCLRMIMAGISDKDAIIQAINKVPFKENDIIYLFTDGYVDQIGGLRRKTFKSVRFKKLLKEISHNPLKEQKSIQREEHEIWRAGQEQIDDILILGVELFT